MSATSSGDICMPARRLHLPCGACARSQWKYLLQRVCGPDRLRINNLFTFGRNGDFHKKKRVSPAGKIRIWHCAAVLFSQVPKKCTHLHLSLLYISIFRTSSRFARENDFQALGVCFPQPCSSAGRRFAATRSLLQNYLYKTSDESFFFHNKKIDEMRCKLDSTENPRSFEKYPTPP